MFLGALFILFYQLLPYACPNIAAYNYDKICLHLVAVTHYMRSTLDREVFLV